MPEQTFRSPNFYDREIDLSMPVVGQPVGIPAGVIGTANKGPAFVPVTVASFNEFISVFGNLDPKKFGPYAANEFLKHRSALTYMRVLGAGANSTDAQVTSTGFTGRVTNAGFTLFGNNNLGDPRGRHAGTVKFLAARHALQTNEAYGMPIFTDNGSYTGGVAHLIRGVIMLPSGANVMVMDGNESAYGAFSGLLPDDSAQIDGGKFKLIISSSMGNTFANTDGNPGVRIFTASLNPTSADYFAKVLNTDPDRFFEEQHYLHADFAVDDELATATIVGILSGSANTSQTSGDNTLNYRQSFSAYDTRFSTPKTPVFISQPFGATEYDLFQIESLDDGEYANKLYKIAITNVKASLDDSDLYGTFSVQVRNWGDTDLQPQVIEQFNNCSLNPNAENYVAKVIGDRKVTFNFDAAVVTERRIVAFGKYPNQSKFIRVVMTDQVEQGVIPARALPFGFHGPELLKTNNSLNDTAPTSAQVRVVGVLSNFAVTSSLSGSIVPPVPYRTKVTKGDVLVAGGAFQGQPGTTEVPTSQLYWGVKFERNTSPTNANLSTEKNACLESFTKFMGIKKLDVLVTGSGADTFNENKFTMARVALSNAAITDLTASISDHMKETAYIRNGKPDTTSYTVNDGVLTTRVTFATILAKDTAANFNKWSPYFKFTTFMYGGFDGLNFLDKNAKRMNDKSISFDTGGGAEASYLSTGMLTNMNGVGQLNSTAMSYKTAVDIMTDPFVVNTNILAIPGIRESYVTDYAATKVRDYGLAYYVMDIPTYDDSTNRLYDDSTGRPSIDQTANTFDARVIDNSYCGTYFPDVFIDDKVNSRKVKVPASVPALGALAFNDRVSYPWFAPAGFNRAALDFVSNVAVRLNVSDRDRLYDSRINPIATFPRLGFVIYGQKTLLINKSARDRVNVRRLLLEVKRIIVNIANNMVFDNNTPEIRNKFVADASSQLGLIQAQAGVESFQVIMNETNNSQEDIDLNRVNGRVVVVPTKVIENIGIDFVITNSGTSFI